MLEAIFGGLREVYVLLFGETSLASIVRAVFVTHNYYEQYSVATVVMQSSGTGSLTSRGPKVKAASKKTRSSAITEGPRDALSVAIYSQLLHNCAKKSYI